MLYGNGFVTIAQNIIKSSLQMKSDGAVEILRSVFLNPIFYQNHICSL